MEFTCQGSQKNDLWLVDNSPDFAIFPANTIPSIKEDTPVWLKVGNQQFGETHIRIRHSHWLKKLGDKTVPELVFLKLRQSGNIYCTDKGSSFKINLSIAPSSLLVLEYLDNHETPHLSVTTLYYHAGSLDGSHIGRYRGNSWGLAK